MPHYLDRMAELEQHFRKVGEDCVFLAKNHETLKSMIEKSILESPDFQSLPTYRRVSVTSFIEGVQSGTARLTGSEGAEKFRVKGPSLRTPVKKQDVPRAVKKLQPEAEWHRHANGGGWVSSTAYVEASAEVGSKAVVYGTARVLERARVYGAAKVRGNAEVSGAAHVHGLAVVEGDAHVFDAARVLGRAVIKDHAKVGGNSVVRGTALVRGEQEVYDDRVAPASFIEELGGKVKRKVG